MSKLVSVMIPTYNAADTIEQTLESILQQSYNNMEIIVVDNASTDSTVELVKRYNDPRLKIIINEVNIGGNNNFNKCIELAQGEYIAIYHADDIYNPDIVEKEVAFLEEYPVGAVFTMAQIIDKTGATIGKLFIPTELKTTPTIYSLKNILPALLKYGNSFLICPSVMVRQHIYKKEIVGWRGELFRSASDTDVWLQILELHNIGIIDEPLMKYRHSPINWSHSYQQLRTEQHDAITVFDYYYDKYKDSLDDQDRKNFKFYKFKDNILRGLNCSIQNKPDEAKKLLQDIFDKEIMRQGIKSLKNIKIYMAGLTLYLSLKINLSNLAAKAIQRIK